MWEAQTHQEEGWGYWNHWLSLTERGGLQFDLDCIWQYLCIVPRYTAQTPAEKSVLRKTMYLGSHQFSIIVHYWTHMMNLDLCIHCKHSARISLLLLLHIGLFMWLKNQVTEYNMQFNSTQMMWEICFYDKENYCNSDMMKIYIHNVIHSNDNLGHSSSDLWFTKFHL